ncbi:MAG: oligoendopeptidase F [Chloroflexi bacterium RBG_13_68_17]|nr:MAG: oligoendopeptidase F [Chloroflexi bacterium RBG_13_68_17]
MATPALPSHDEIDPRYTWNAPSLFPSVQAWEAGLTEATHGLAALARFPGRLAEGPSALAEALDVIAAVMLRVGRVWIYAGMSAAVDTTDQTAARMSGQAQALVAMAAAAAAFLNPELLAIGEPTLRAWISSEPCLAHLTHYVDDLFRRQTHIRSAEIEELLGMLADPFASVESTMGLLTNADFQFPPARAGSGDPLELTQTTLLRILSGTDRLARQSAWEGYHDVYLAHRNTLASNLITSVKRSVLFMRARRHASTLEATLFENNLPEAVFHNLIATFRKHLPTWRRYFALRKRLLGVDLLQPYDMWAPLTGNRRPIPYEQAVDWICAGLAPMGAEYVETMRRGCLHERWVDVFPCRGKSAGAFSSGRQGTLPFIKTSYSDSVLSLSTLAHELGHSMHSYLTWQHQPYIYCDYSNFVAEVASNFHQAMVRAHLLASDPDADFQAELIEEAMANFYRYFFIMPTLARFELEVHQREEQGRGLSADDMIALCADLFSEGFGDQVHVDRSRLGIVWATFGHLYADYYVFQYATGISGAQALAGRILSGTPGAVDDYLAFLKTGSSQYPREALRLAGVDLTTPEPVEAAFAAMGGLIDRLQVLADG